MRLYTLQADPVGERVRLGWTVGGDRSAAFTVEHRADSTAAWSILGTVAASDSIRSDTTRGAAYRYRTESLEVGPHQFRLGVSGGAAPSGRAKQYTPPVTVRVRMQEAYRLATYPNPARNRATIELTVREEQAVSVSVYDLLGRRVATLHEGRLPGQETVRIPLSVERRGLGSGSYFVRVAGEDFTATERVAVVR